MNRGESAGSPRFISNAPKLGFVPPFDGFRGIGVALVVVVHATGERLAGLASLVDIFFIISGFLIVTLLLQEDRSDGSISLRQFFFRRAIRLFPVMYTVLAFTLVGGLIFGDAKFRSETMSDVGAAAIYMYHVIHPVNQTLLTGGAPPARPLIQLWSLSVEEHFYLFGALLTVLAIRFRLIKQIIAVFLAFWVFVAIARATSHVGWDMMWYQRPDAIAIGVALAFFNALLPKELSPKAIKLIRILGGAGLIVMLLTMISGTDLAKPFGFYVESWPPKGHSLNNYFLWGKYGYSLSSLSATLMVFCMVRGGEDFWVSKSMSMGWARALGRRSYCIYLIHFPLFMILQQAAGDSQKKQALATLAYLPLLVISTELTHRYVEISVARYFRDRQKAKQAARAAGAA